MDLECKEVLRHRIKLMRIKYNLTQDVLADKLEMKRANVSSYESGKNAPPPHILSELASIFNTTTDYLLGKTDNPEPLTVRDINTISIDELRNFDLQYKGVKLNEAEKEKVIHLIQSVLDLKR